MARRRKNRLVWHASFGKDQQRGTSIGRRRWPQLRVAIKVARYYRDELSRRRKAEQEAKARPGEREKDTCRVEGPYSRESTAIKPAKITCNSSRIDRAARVSSDDPVALQRTECRRPSRPSKPETAEHKPISTRLSRKQFRTVLYTLCWPDQILRSGRCS